MNKSTSVKSISVVVPIYNEAQGLISFHIQLLRVLKSLAVKSYEIIYCDDGSTDSSANIIKKFCTSRKIKLIKLSRNFGKENALAAGIAQARGDAVIMIDGDGQHPVELIAKFVSAWEEGAQVVIGVRKGVSDTRLSKRVGSRAFYSIYNKVTNQKIVPGSTDFRLIDRCVQQAFIRLGESDRITRGLIDWLGFKRRHIYFSAKKRETGIPGYSLPKLISLAANSFISLTSFPLYFFGFLGIFITTTSLITGGAIIIEQLILGDPLSWNFTGTAMLGILTLFLVGIVLLYQGIVSLYISHIHTQSKQRPLYVIDYDNSAGINNNEKL